MALPGMEAPWAPMPEWPGAVSGKFTDKLHGRDNQKRQVVSFSRDGADHGLARNGFASYFNDPSGLLPSEGRRPVPHAGGSEVCNWKPSKRSLSEPGQLHNEKPEGRRFVDDAPKQVFTIREKRHIRQVESKEEYGDRQIGPSSVMRDNGLRACDQPAREVDISNEMARKVRPLDLLTQRNGIECRAHGDKPYRHPEYERGFHKAGSLVVGSSFHRGHYKKTEPRNSTTIHLVMDNTKKQLKSYEEKFREQMVSEAQQEVQALTRSWETSALKDCQEAKFADIDSDDETSAAAS